VAGVRIGEQQVELALSELALDRRELVIELLLELGVVTSKLLQLDKVSRPLIEPLPGRDLFSKLRRLAAVAPRLRRVVPDPGLG
jgi:hypothetical protein